MSFKILGTGHYVPERVLTNDEMSTMVETSDEWIAQRVGIRERRVCTTETASELAFKAAEKALEMSGVKPEELDMILCATISADDASPSMACMVQNLLGASCPAMDISAACSGFIYMLDTAAGFFARGKVKKMLVVGAERLSRLVDWTDRNTCVIFADGAGAAVLGAGDNYLSSKLFAKGGDTVIKIPNYQGTSPFYQVESPSPYIKMNGQETFKFAVNAMAGDLAEVIESAGITQSDIAWVIPHQANLRIIDAAGRKLDIPAERFAKNIEKYGNTSAASIPILIDELHRDGQFKNGDYIALCSFGGGLSSAACVIRWGD
ncbi:ketoacyl-ACP synthase III [Oscillospiraceae bacterium CM]|nr:ketoacyl-ACP synthase III [Oscillospiraceae bacterium CM]